MRAKLRRHWFLLMLAAGALIVWLRPGWVAWVGALDPRLVVALSLFLAAWSLESRSIARSLLRPAPAIWATVISYGFLPLVAWLWLPLLPLDDFRIGFMLIASVPCTLASAVLWTRMAGGNEATALLGILLSTSTGWILTALWLKIGTATETAIDSAGMMQSLILVLVLPVGAGQLCRVPRVMARIADGHKMAIGVVGRLLIFLIMLRAAVDVRLRISDWPETLSAAWLLSLLASCLGLHLAALFVAYHSGRTLGFDRPERIALAFASSQKTLPVALYLFEAYYPQYPLAVLPLAFYHVGQLIVDTFIAESWAGRHQPIDIINRASRNQP